jgi:hypothetical protein
VWSARHTNLPPENYHIYKRVFGQTIYVALGLLAPEWLSYLAINDLGDAREIKSLVNYDYSGALDYRPNLSQVPRMVNETMLLCENGRNNYTNRI